MSGRLYFEYELRGVCFNYDDSRAACHRLLQPAGGGRHAVPYRGELDFDEIIYYLENDCLDPHPDWCRAAGPVAFTRWDVAHAGSPAGRLWFPSLLFRSVRRRYGERPRSYECGLHRCGEAAEPERFIEAGEAALNRALRAYERGAADGFDVVLGRHLNFFHSQRLPQAEVPAGVRAVWDRL